MGNIGLPEVLLIVVVALLVFGPERLPEFAREAGRFIARFREETSRSVAELKRAAELDDLDRELRSMRAELKGVGRQLTGADEAPSPPGTAGARAAPPPTDPEAT